MDEDGLPISASLYLIEEDEVFDAFKVMVVRTVLGVGEMATNEDGVDYHVADASLDAVPVSKMVQAYDFIVGITAYSKKPRVTLELNHLQNMRDKIREMLE